MTLRATVSITSYYYFRYGKANDQTRLPAGERMIVQGTTKIFLAAWYENRLGNFADKRLRGTSVS